MVGNSMEGLNIIAPSFLPFSSHNLYEKVIKEFSLWNTAEVKNGGSEVFQNIDTKIITVIKVGLAARSFSFCFVENKC